MKRTKLQVEFVARYTVCRTSVNSGTGMTSTDLEAGAKSVAKHVDVYSFLFGC